MCEEEHYGPLAIQQLRRLSAHLAGTSVEIEQDAVEFAEALLPAVEWLVETSMYESYFAFSPVGNIDASSDVVAQALTPLFNGARLNKLTSDDVLPELAGSKLKAAMVKLTLHEDGCVDRRVRDLYAVALGALFFANRSPDNALLDELGRLVGEHAGRTNEASAAPDCSGPPAYVSGRVGRTRKWNAWFRKTGGVAAVASRFKALKPVGALLRWTGSQCAEILGELRRATRPPVKVRWMEGNALGIQLSAHHGGGFVVVPMPNGNMADVMSVERGRSGHSHTVNIFRQYSRGGQLLRDRAWSIHLKDAATADFVMANLVGAYTRGRSGSHPWRNMMLAAVAVVVVAVVAIASVHKPGQSASPVPVAQASTHDPMSAALAATSFNAEGGLPPELMAQILAGAQEAQADTQNKVGIASDIEHESASMFQSRMHAGGPPQVPEEDVDMNSFGLGRTIAGCDPSLKFKVGAEQ